MSFEGWHGWDDYAAFYDWENARTVARRVDGFWDAAEGRMVPEPLHHHERNDDGRFTQYLLADPHLPDEDDPEDRS